MPVAVPSTERIAAIGLVTAALTILVLAILGVYESQAETQLLRDVIGAQQAKEGLESLGSKMHELRFAATVHRLTGSAGAAQEVQRRLVEIEGDLDYLVERARTETGLAETIAPLDEAVRSLLFHVRSTPSRTRAAGAAVLALEADQLETRAREALDRALDAQSRRIYDGSTAQIRVGENLKFYVSTLLAGSVGVLVGLFVIFQYAQRRARLAHERIEHLAHFDPLTELPNRTLLTDRFVQERSRARRSGKGFSVVLFDLDGFKGVNDSMGHAAGDVLLAEVSRRLRTCVRDSDTVGRLGGDEFLAILPESGRDGALHVAEKIRVALEAPYAIAGKTAKVTATLGIALFPEHGEDADAIFRAADAALYEAKRAGRNRAQVATAGSRPSEAPR